MDQVKRCSACGVVKFLFHFHRDKSQPDGHISHCKSCRKIIRAAKYARDPQRYIESNRVYRAGVNVDPLKKSQQLWQRKLRRVYNQELGETINENRT